MALLDCVCVYLGYGMSGDLRSLVSTWPDLREEPMKMEGVLDLLLIHQEVPPISIQILNWQTYLEIITLYWNLCRFCLHFTFVSPASTVLVGQQKVQVSGSE